jgi:hypothetical protein
VITTLAALVVGPASSSAAVAGMVTLGSWLANKIADTLEARAEAKRQSEAQTESLFERVLTSCKTIDELCSTCSELRYNRTERIIRCVQMSSTTCPRMTTQMSSTPLRLPMTTTRSRSCWTTVCATGWSSGGCTGRATLSPRARGSQWLT